jgi:hypothetical protein
MFDYIIIMSHLDDLINICDDFITINKDDQCNSFIYIK